MNREREFEEKEKEKTLKEKKIVKGKPGIPIERKTHSLLKHTL